MLSLHLALQSYAYSQNNIKWIADNNDGIIEFLKSKGKYTLVEPAENTDEDFGDNDTDNEDDNEEETVEEMNEE